MSKTLSGWLFKSLHSSVLRDTHHHQYVPSVVNRSAVMDLHRSRSCATLMQSYDIFVHSLMLSVHIVLGLPRPPLPFILPPISSRCTPYPLIICPKYWHFLFLIVFNNDLLVFILCKTSPLVIQLSHFMQSIELFSRSTNKSRNWFTVIFWDYGWCPLNPCTDSVVSQLKVHFQGCSQNRPMKGNTSWYSVLPWDFEENLATFQMPSNGGNHITGGIAVMWKDVRRLLPSKTQVWPLQASQLFSTWQLLIEVSAI